MRQNDPLKNKTLTTNSQNNDIIGNNKDKDIKENQNNYKDKKDNIDNNNKNLNTNKNNEIKTKNTKDFDNKDNNADNNKNLIMLTFLETTLS